MRTFRVSKIQGYSADVFYGVLIPLVILVGALSLCIVVIVIKSRKTHLQNSVEDLKAKTDKSVVPSVVIQKTDSLLSRKSVKGTNRATVEIVENGITGVANQAFVPDAFPESGGEDGDNKRTEQLSTSTEDNDVHPRSSHSDHNMDEFGYCNLTSAGMYMAIGDLRKAGVDEEETARDGDIGNNYSTDTNSKDETDQSTSDVSESHNTLADELNGNDPDKATKAFSEDITDTSYLDRAPEVPTPDYILDDAQSQCEPKEITWVVPKTSGQVESEIIEFLLTPDFIENVSETLASSGSLSAGVAPQIEGPLESTDTTDGNHSDSISMTEKDKKNNDEDNLLPEWASKALQPTIRPISSREEFKSHLESLISAPPQLPPSKTLPSSLTPSLSSQSPVTTPKGKASPPPPPPQLPSSSTAEAPSASIPPSPPPLPPIQIMATHL